MVRGVATVFGVFAMLIITVAGAWALWWLSTTFIRQHARRKRQREIEQLQKMAEKKDGQ